jgi:serine/threonine protein kinase
VDEFDRLPSRWKIEKLLGTGGFGVVYAVLDLHRSERVALKTLRRFEPAALVHFKKEFRLLSDMVHPHLVSLYELVSDTNLWFFTMELIDGTDLLTYSRGGDQVRTIEPSHVLSRSRAVDCGNLQTNPDFSDHPDATVLRAATAPPVSASRVVPLFRELADGLTALHQAKKLHCDIKPSNILVDKSGRVVVLDFGLVTDVTATYSQKDIMGTVAYMSPEQAAGRPLDGPSDWYSFGVVLYEALTGRLPIEGNSAELLMQKQLRDPVPPQRLVAQIPSDLSRLCSRLLSRNPGARPGPDEVFAVLGGTPSEIRLRTPSESSLLVGRAPEVEFLRDAFDVAGSGRMVTVYVHGESGIGKSLLVQHFLDKARVSGSAVILQGRCYERESVPYKALDSLVDALARHIERLPTAVATSIVPASIGALARIFPVLCAVNESIRAAAWAVSIPDPQELRRRAVEAFRQLLRNLSKRRTVILFIDDLQWGDLDSAIFLSDLIREGANISVLLLTCFRGEDRESSPCLRAVPQPGHPGADIREIELAGLDPAKAAELWRIFLGNPELATAGDDIVPELHGNPFFLQELARHRVISGASFGTGGTVLKDILSERIERLPADASRILTFIALAGQPISEGAVRRAAGVEAHSRLVGLLRAESLIRTVGERADRLVAFHDRIREAVVSTLDPAGRREGHARVAAALEHTGEAAPETLAHHHHAAQNYKAAATYSADAARRALQALAFENAAHLYQRALQLRSRAETRAFTPELAGETRALQVGLARSLANAGRGVEAADAFLAASESATGRELLELQQSAAEKLLHAGHVDRGLNILKSLLNTVGVPFPKRGRIPYSLLYWRLRARLKGIRWKECSADNVAPEVLLRIDACSSVATGLALVDIARGAALQGVNYVLSLSAGEPYRVARALAMEAGYRSTAGGRARERARHLIHAATELSERTRNPDGLGLSLVMAAGCAWNDGRWNEARLYAQQARTVLEEQCQGLTWERDTANIFEVDALRWMGRWAQMKAQLPPLIANARSRGDLYAETILQMHCGSCAALADDDPEGALNGLAILDRWTHGSFYVEHLIEMHNQVEIALYRGDGKAALALLNSRWPALRHSLLLRVQTFRIQMFSLRARAALGAAAASHSTEIATILRQAGRDAKTILRQRTPWCRPIGRIIEACVATLQLKPQKAIYLFRQAEIEAESVGMVLHVCAAKFCRGRLIGEEEGRNLAAEAASGMSSEGVMNPAALTAVIAPCGQPGRQQTR